MDPASKLDDIFNTLMEQHKNTIFHVRDSIHPMGLPGVWSTAIPKSQQKILNPGTGTCFPQRSSFTAMVIV